MDQELNRLIQTLRDELQQYGGLLVRLDRQPRWGIRPSGDNEQATAHDLPGLGIVIQRVRWNREQARQALAVSMQLSPETELEAMIPVLPTDYQPLVNALVQENRELLARVLAILRQHQLFLADSMARLEDFSRHIFPGIFEKAPAAPAVQALPMPMPGVTFNGSDERELELEQTGGHRRRVG